MKICPAGKTGSITIPNDVFETADYAFAGCSKLTNIIFPDNEITIGKHCFEGCSSLASISIPNPKYIGIRAFGYCDSLEEIIVSDDNDNYTSVNGVLFSKAKTTLIAYAGKDANYTIPEGVKYIDDSAFKGCIRLTSVTIPQSVTSIGYEAFDGCEDSLKDIYYCGTKDEWEKINKEWYGSLYYTNYHYRTVSVNEISISPSSLELKVGQSQNLSITIAPENATNKEVTWTSNNPNVATVVDGKVTAVAPGEAIIAVKTVDGEKTASCTVTVTEVRLTGITLDKTEATLAEGEKLKLNVTYTPADASYRNIIWSSSDEAVAKVANGEVTAVKAGKATIKAVAEDGGFEAKCEVTVKEKETNPDNPSDPDNPANPESHLGPDKPDLSQYTASANEIAVKSINLKKTVFSDVKGIKKFEVTSGDAAAVKIKGSTLTVLQNGTVTIAAKNKAGEKLAEKTVKVVLPVVKTTETTEINRRGNLDMNKYITSIVKPSKWKSSSKKIAEVSQDGLLTMKKSGKVKITVTFPAEKGMKAKTLTIKLNIKMPQFKKTTYTVKVGKFVQTAVKNADTAGITYKTENPAIATVDAAGK
nr:Ig-like domain-containing protein [Lachnospiraceae bacterium]